MRPTQKALVSAKNSSKELSAVERRHLKVALYKEQKRKLKAAPKKEWSLDHDYTKKIEWGILMTIGLGVLSVSNPQVTPLALIMAILILAAIIDSQLKIWARKSEKNKENEALNKKVMERYLRIVENQNRPPSLPHLKRSLQSQTATINYLELESLK